MSAWLLGVLFSEPEPMLAAALSGWAEAQARREVESASDGPSKKEKSQPATPFPVQVGCIITSHPCTLELHLIRLPCSCDQCWATFSLLFGPPRTARPFRRESS